MRLVLPTEQPEVELRQYRLEDADDIFSLIAASGSHLSQRGDQTAAKYPTVEAVAESIRLNNPRQRLRCGIWDRDRLVGGVNLQRIGRERPIGEIGYWLGAATTGHGYATFATRSLTEYGLTVLSYRFIVAKVVTGNDDSVAVLLRAGFAETKPTPHGDHRWFIY